MARAVIAWSVVALVAATAGCRMPAHPYDYCGPTFTGECGTPCDPNARAGSILSESVEPMSDYEEGVPTEMQEMQEVPDTLTPIPESMSEVSPATSPTAGSTRVAVSRRTVRRSSQGMPR